MIILWDNIHEPEQVDMCVHARQLICALVLLGCSCLGFCQNHQVGIADLNGDGQPDIVVANPSLNNIGVFLNIGNDTLGPGSFLAVAGRPTSISLFDVNADGQIDIVLVVAASSTTQLQAMLGDGKSPAFGALTLGFCLVSCGGGNSTPPPTIGTPPGTSSITVTATSGTTHSVALTVTVTP